jgi:hypothetical protein
MKLMGAGIYNKAGLRARSTAAHGWFAPVSLILQEKWHLSGIPDSRVALELKIGAHFKG